MCGIVGCMDWSGQNSPDESLLRRMLAIVRHRGPDESGLYLDDQVGMGCARLSVIDLETGHQPIGIGPRAGMQWAFSPPKRDKRQNKVLAGG